jgi:hypothetical protein
MVIKFPSNPTDGQVFDIQGKTYIYNINKGYWRAKLNFTVASIPQAQLNLYKLSLMRQ